MVVAVVAVATRSRRVEDARETATAAALDGLRLRARSRRPNGRNVRDLALGLGAGARRALGGGRLGGVPAGLFVADPLDVELRREEEEDHRDGRDRDRGVTRARQRHPEEDRDRADQREAGQPELREGRVPQRREDEMDHDVASRVLAACQPA
jgi:hypothetical protein